MIDMHVHLERGAYTFEWLDKFIEQASKTGIKTLGVLEHSHRFHEFYDMYEPVRSNDSSGYQSEWINRRSEIDFASYIEFIDKAKERKYPVKLNFGIEVCYFPGYENFITSVLEKFNGDFLTGAIHWIDGWGFDHPKTKDTWLTRKVDNIYIRYYELMIMMVESKLFDIVAHPDSIKCFNYNTNLDLSEIYQKLVEAVIETGMKMEFNTGLHYRYGHNELGPSEGLMKMLAEKRVPIVTGSDAHSPEDVGKEIQEAYRKLTAYGYIFA